MRRLWANILIACAGILAVFAAMPSTINKINTNGDYTTQRQFTFQLTARSNGDEEKPEITDPNAAKNIAKTMESRLITSKVTSYDITTSGNDIVTVTYYTNDTSSDDSKYKQINTYLGFSGSFALMNEVNDLVNEKDFKNGAAYILNKSVNEAPTVIIPIKTDSDDYKKMISQARENSRTEKEDETNEDDPGTEVAYIYLLYNWDEDCVFEEQEASAKLSERIFLKFNAITDEGLYYGGAESGGRASFAQVCNFGDSNGNGVLDPQEVTAAFDQADYLCNLLNSSPLDYDVKVIKGYDDTKVFVPAKIETIKTDITLKINFNATMISILVAVIVISLLLVVFYRLGALNIMATTLVGTFLTFLFVTLMGIEYNSLSIIGYILVAIVGIVAGVIYCSKLKDEAYRGRSLKKANAEASKKSLLPIVDVHVISIIIGVMIFLLGGASLHSFASILTLGSIISLIICTLGLKGLMWLATNTTKLTGKYGAFGIDESNVPNHMAEEKQRYFGAYADKDFSKRKKPVSIAGAAVFVAALIGIILSASFNSGNLFKQPVSKQTNSDLYLTTQIEVTGTTTKTKLTNDIVDNMMKDIIFYTEGETLPDPIPANDPHRLINNITTNVSAIKAFDVSETETIDSETKNYTTTYYVLPLKSNINPDNYKAMVVSEEHGTKTYESLTELFENYFDDYGGDYFAEENSAFSLKTNSTYVNAATPDWQKMSLAIFVAVLVCTVYVMLRYRLSRGLAMLIYPIASTGISLGFFVLLSVCGLSLPANICIAVPVICMFTYIYMVMFANKERDLLSEDKVKDNTLEHRVDVSKRAMGIIFTPVLAVLAIVVYILVNFFGFAPAVNSFAYLASIVGVLVSLGLVAITYPALSNLLFKWFSKVKIERKPRKHKNKVVVKKSAEPEEAIFIGIND